MHDFEKLSDDEVLDLARQWRREALRGNKEARGIAHEYEVEHRRRVGPTPRMSTDVRSATTPDEIALKPTWRERWVRFFRSRELA